MKKVDLSVTFKDIQDFSTTMIKSNRPESFTIDWGDGQVENFDNISGEVELNHNYNKKGNYTVSFDFGNVTLADKYKTHRPFITFGEMGIVKVSGILPFMKLTPYCYNWMFAWNEISDISGFSLPAKQTSKCCYEGMFADNQLTTLGNLVLPLELHNLSYGCYVEMFNSNKLKSDEIYKLTERSKVDFRFSNDTTENEIEGELDSFFGDMFADNKELGKNYKWYMEFDLYENLYENRVMSFGQFLNENKMNEIDSDEYLEINKKLSFKNIPNGIISIFFDNDKNVHFHFDSTHKGNIGGYEFSKPLKDEIRDLARFRNKEFINVLQDLLAQQGFEINTKKESHIVNHGYGIVFGLI